MKKTTTTRTTSKQHPVYAYLVDRLLTVEEIAQQYDEVVEDTVKARIEWTVKTFKAEYLYPANVRRYGNNTNVFAQYLMGLPSSFSVDFENYKILEIAKEWGVFDENANERDEDRIINNWFNFVANKFHSLCRFHSVPF